MLHQHQHAILPTAQHDESARQEYANALKIHISSEIGPLNRVIAENRVIPSFEQKHGRLPSELRELRLGMSYDPGYRTWGALTRLSQELMWDSVEESVSRQLPGLIDQARSPGSLGSLRLDTDLASPRYMSAVDIHAMPGGYVSEVMDDDVRAGALFDRGTYINVCGTQGVTHDARGLTVCSYLGQRYPQLSPARILDMGCSVGQATIPYVRLFPEAEVHAIDVAAPLLRYAHARANSLGAAIHFSQQNAESTNFPDGHFDLIVSHLLFHETSTTALRNIIRECKRLLRPNGMMLHLELGMPYKDMDLVDQVVHDWQTQNNAEPFWAKINTTDTAVLAQQMGFNNVKSGYLRRSEGLKKGQFELGPKPQDTDAHPQGSRTGCEVFFVMEACK